MSRKKGAIPRPKTVPSKAVPSDEKASDEKKPSAFGKPWLAGLIAALLSGLTVWYLEYYKTGAMEVRVEDSPFVSRGSTGYFNGWTTTGDRDYKVIVRNVSDVTIYDCTPSVYALPLGVPRPSAIYSMDFPSTSIKPGQEMQWIDVRVVLDATYDKFTIGFSVSCAYYDVFHFKHSIRYEDKGIKDFIKPSFSNVRTYITKYIADRKSAERLSKRLSDAEGADDTNQMMMLESLQKEVGVQSQIAKAKGDWSYVPLIQQLDVLVRMNIARQAQKQESVSHNGNAGASRPSGGAPSNPVDDHSGVSQAP